MQVKEIVQPEQNMVFDEHKEFEKLLEQLEGFQQHVDQLVEKDHKGKLYFFRHLEVVQPVLDKDKKK